jgi:hypothetical protein
MAEKTVAEKLRLKPGMGALILDAPPDVLLRLGLPADVTLRDDPATADFLLVFVGTQTEAEAKVGALAPAVGDKTIAWIAYPKGSKAAGHDVNRDTVARFVTTVGLVVCANFSIDATWSALRVRPLKP